MGGGPHPKSDPAKTGVFRPYEDIGAGFKAACERAKIRDLRFHDLRRTFETRGLAGGANPVNIVKIMGHHSIPFSFNHYFHPTAAGLLEGLDKALNTKEYTKECSTAPPVSDRRADN